MNLEPLGHNLDVDMEIQLARANITTAHALIEKEWPTPDTYAYDAYAFAQIPVREWPTQEVRMAGHLGTFFRRGKNRYACPVCSALVHVDDIHRHAGWHGMNQITLDDDRP